MVRIKEETDAVGARGLAIYESVIASQLSDDDRGRYVAIDINSGGWEIDDTRDATETLRARVPDAEIFLLRHPDIDTGYFGAPRGLLKSLRISDFVSEMSK